MSYALTAAGYKRTGLAMLAAGVGLLFLLSPLTTRASDAYTAAKTAATAAVAAAAKADGQIADTVVIKSADIDKRILTAADAEATAAEALAAAATLAAADAKAAKNAGDTAGATAATSEGVKNQNLIIDALKTTQRYLPFASDDATWKAVNAALARIQSANSASANATSQSKATIGDTQGAQTDAGLSSASANAAGAAQAKADGVCRMATGDWGACLRDAMFGLIKTIALFFLMLASFFLGLAGLLLNWVIYITVFQFGNLIGNNAGILAAWGVLRDIGNIILLFGFIFMGVSTILNLPRNEFTAKRALPLLIIFAVLMNFSLFAAEAVIDVSNGLGSSFYRQAGNGLCTDSSSTLTAAKECAINQGISGKIMRVTGISSIFNLTEAGTKEDFPNDDLGSAIGIIGLTLFAAVTAFVLLAAVFMLITRAVTLAFLMAVSPIGFAGMAIPPLHKYATQWWDQLIKQSFFAPIYILCILISIKFIEGITVALSSTAGGGPSNLAAAFSSSGASNVSMLVTFILMIGFMLAATAAAKSLGAAGASSATKWAGSLTYGTAAFVGRRTAGRAATIGAEQLRKTNFGRTGLGKLAVGTLDAGGKASFDFRSTGAAAALGKVTGVDMGKAHKGGYSGIIHEKEEAEKKYADSLRATKAERDRKTALEASSAAANIDNRQAELDHQADSARLNADLATAAAQEEAILGPMRAAAAQKQRDIETARRAGNVAQANALELSLNNDLRLLDIAKGEAERRLEPAKAAIAREDQSYKARLARNQATIATNTQAIKKLKTKPKTDYAHNLENPNPIVGAFNLVAGVGYDSARHAAHAIEDDVNKDETQKLLEALNRANANAAQANNGGHATPAAPAAPAHPPAAGGGHHP